MTKIFVSPVPFGEFDKTPIKLLEKSGFDVSYNPYSRKLSAKELSELASDADVSLWWQRLHMNSGFPGDCKGILPSM